MQEVNKSDLLLRFAGAVRHRQVADRYPLPRSTLSLPFYVFPMCFFTT